MEALRLYLEWYLLCCRVPGHTEGSLLQLEGSHFSPSPSHDCVPAIVFNSMQQRSWPNWAIMSHEEIDGVLVM
ncbi:hypothetical protein CLOM_g12749 [Closterium sp. NIES-68]|nr:hypothetical protein CLOM_g8421 [Closterium sp. NIES-68]GJP53595.1 hypothetical protein CLOM_g12749 [Closterium sp. NIES-68]GJP59097.1 hypothetical protein CLOP_g7537 [Closterium sp. NIES-67]